MRRRTLLSIVAALAATAFSAGSPASSLASSTLAFRRCSAEPALQCAALPVPLERSGAVPGTITLSFARKLAGAQPSSSAVLVLAGGPGQAALPFAEFAGEAMSAALHTRDLLVFDQRGTGNSDPLSCAALERPTRAPASSVLASCAAELGPARGAFTTQESVRDIESLREALGYQKLVLYGTSYGTKVALEYAERYPQDVEALVLDSVVPTDGPEPFAIPTFEAVDGVVRELCSQDLCAGITPEPLADLTRLIARLRARPLRGTVYDGFGRRHSSSIGEAGLLRVLEAGDLNPALRALLPAAVRSALGGEGDPLLRLQALSEGLVPSIPTSPHEEAGDTDETLFVTTSCEEAPFPWNRAAAPSTRLHEALAYLDAQPAGEFAPFDARTALQTSLVEACDAWPDASPPPPAPGPLPDVPTLILSGAQDLRTPTADARQVAAAIPGAQLLVVPFTGHSVVGSDLTGCASSALDAFFAGQPVQPCAARDVLAPTPLTPRSLAAIHPPAGLGGRPGRTLVATLDTLIDLERQVITATLQADAKLPSGSSFGGLHGGFARISTHKAVLHDLSFVPGVTLTGTFAVSGGRLLPSTIRIGGRDAAHGTVHVGATTKRVSGTLGGHSFDLLLSSVRASRAGGGEWPSAQQLLARLGPRVGAAPARLP